MRKHFKTKMKKQISIFLFIFLSLVVIGQKDLIVIKGKIYDGKHIINTIPGMNTWLIINDTLIIESQPDSSGAFEYKISRNFFKWYKIELTAFQDQKILDKMCPKDCPYLRMLSTYFRNDVSVKVPSDSTTEIIMNLNPNHAYIDMRNPCIGFKKNSVEFTNCSSDNSDTSLFCIRFLLKENPEYMVKINIHSWNENDINSLSVKRGKYILDKLNSLNVDTNRVIIKIQDDHRPLIRSDFIKRAPTKADKEALDQKNRRATFQLTTKEHETGLQTK
jgi:hypothetical protein